MEAETGYSLGLAGLAILEYLVRSRERRACFKVTINQSEQRNNVAGFNRQPHTRVHKGVSEKRRGHKARQNDMNLIEEIVEGEMLVRVEQRVRNG